MSTGQFMVSGHLKTEINIFIMDRLKLFFAALAIVCTQVPAVAQILDVKDVAPMGTVVYSLPSTTIVLKVTAEHESYQAGPYAPFAKKYLGIDVRQQSGDFYSIKSLEMVPYIEADPFVSAAVNLQGSKVATANFLQMCSQGLIALSDGYVGKPAQWRFPSAFDAHEFLDGSSSNIHNTTTTLYKTVKSAVGVEKIPVKQEQTVVKSVEKKAEETAEMIFKLRQKRVDIITGDTDATFSGEAMAATLAEIKRLEDEYMSMFVGKSVWDEQTMTFDVVPQASNKKHIYIAFRISDSQGLLHANNVEGRPVVLELSKDVEPIAPDSVSDAALATKGKVAYRKPVTVIAKITDGQQVLIQQRIPVYQLGSIMSFPIETMMR